MAIAVSEHFEAEVKKHLLGQLVFEVWARCAGDPENASGADEIEVELGNGRTLLVYADDSGVLHAEID